LLAVVCTDPWPEYCPAPSDFGQAAEALLEIYPKDFSITHQAVLKQQAARQGAVEPNSDGIVSPLGERFPLVGMDAATKSLAAALDEMNAEFEGPPEVYVKFCVHLLRYVGAPGV
jgi:hypothetical protein